MKRVRTLPTHLARHCLENRVEVNLDSRGLDLGGAEIFEVLDRFEVEAAESRFENDPISICMCEPMSTPTG